MYRLLFVRFLVVADFIQGITQPPPNSDGNVNPMGSLMGEWEISRAQPNSREKGANYAAVFGENVCGITRKLRGRAETAYIPR
jgi:hypothetical protein